MTPGPVASSDLTAPAAPKGRWRCEAKDECPKPVGVPLHLLAQAASGGARGSSCVGGCRARLRSAHRFACEVGILGGGGAGTGGRCCRGGLRGQVSALAGPRSAGCRWRAGVRAGQSARRTGRAGAGAACADVRCVGSSGGRAACRVVTPGGWGAVGREVDFDGRRWHCRRSYPLRVTTPRQVPSVSMSSRPTIAMLEGVALLQTMPNVRRRSPRAGPSARKPGPPGRATTPSTEPERPTVVIPGALRRAQDAT